MERGHQATKQWSRRKWLQGATAAGAAVALGGPARLLHAAPELPLPSQLRGAESGLNTGGRGSLRAHAEARGLLVGCAVNVAQLGREPAYGRVITEQFDLIVGENCMKWGQLRPTSTTYDFQGADALVDFATEHGLKVRGHNLCWHENLPDWFFDTVTRDNAKATLADHIRTVVTRYRGRVESWDVVNEAIEPKDGLPAGLRRTPWYDLIGPDYLDLAFRTAREADPNVPLVYNDFGIEYDTVAGEEKRAAVLALLTRLRRMGVPLGGVGIQSHLRTENLLALGPGLREFLRTVGRMGLHVYLSEMDVDDDGLIEGDTPQQDREVAAVYSRYLDALLSEPCVKALLTWGVADQGSWLQAEKWRSRNLDRLQRPLLLSEVDGAYMAKPAFYAVRNAIDDAHRR